MTDIRRRAGLLGVATSLALAAAVVTAAPAEARRNLGGFDTMCVATPGQALAGKQGRPLGATQICFTADTTGASVVIATPKGK